MTERFRFNLLITVLFISLSLFGHSILLAQDTTINIIPTTVKLRHKDLKNAVSTNSFGVFEQKFDLSYERAVSKAFSLCATLEVGSYSVSEMDYYTMNGGSLVSVSSSYKLSGGGFSIEGRYYPLEKRKIAPRGLFAGAYYKHLFLKEHYEGAGVVVNDNHQASGIGIDIGYKFGRKNFMFEPLAGYAAHWDNGVGSNPKIDPVYTEQMMWTLFIRIEGRIGFVF
jgi:hypothetical protein